MIAISKKLEKQKYSDYLLKFPSERSWINENSSYRRICMDFSISIIYYNLRYLKLRYDIKKKEENIKNMNEY